MMYSYGLLNEQLSGSARVFGYTVYRGFLNRVYSILQLKYGYSVYHFLWISGIKYTWVYFWVYLDEFWVFWAILANFFRVYWHTTIYSPMADPELSWFRRWTEFPSGKHYKLIAWEVRVLLLFRECDQKGEGHN